jgi:hypothetical protein
METPKTSNRIMFCFLLYLIAVPYVVMLIYALALNLGLTNMTSDDLSNWLMVWEEPIIVLPPIIVYMLISSRPLGRIVPHKKLTIKNIIMIAILTFLCMPTMNLVAEITGFFVEDTVNTTIFDTIKSMNPITSIFAFAIMPAIFEELIMRGVIMSGYKRLNMFKAVMMSGLYFGLFHMDLQQLPYTFMGGVVLGTFVFCTNSIYGSMWAHFLLNGIQVVYSVLFYQFADEELLAEMAQQTTTMQDKIDSLVSTSVAVLFTLPIFIMLLKRFIKINRNNITEYKYGMDEQYLNIDISSVENVKNDEKIVDVFFILCIVLYVAYMVFTKLVLKY